MLEGKFALIWPSSSSLEQLYETIIIAMISLNTNARPSIDAVLDECSNLAETVSPHDIETVAETGNEIDKSYYMMYILLVTFCCLRSL